MSYKIKIIYSLCILFCLCACSDDRFSNPDPVVSPPAGEIISGKNLSLVISPLSSPVGKLGSTRADGSVPVLKASFSGMDVELSGSSAADTRALLPENEESKIYSVAILQFDGTSTSSVCVQATYIPENPDGKIDLTNFSFKTGNSSTVSRIAVIANLSSDYLNLPDWNGSTQNKKYYQSLLNLFMEYNAQDTSNSYPLYKTASSKRILMFGLTDVTLEQGKLVTVVMQRILAKIQLDIKIDGTVNKNYSNWQARLMNLPKKTYLMPAGRGTTFPTSANLGSDGYYNMDAVSISSSDTFKVESLSYYIPINIHPDVPTATTQSRTLVAPRGSTYLQIVGTKSDGVNMTQVIYQIFLGSNFTTNYSLSPNSNYKYTIHIRGESDQDGSIIKFIPGYWGGALKAYDKNGTLLGAIDNTTATKWRYEKKIEIYSTDIVLNEKTEMYWGLSTVSNATSLWDGYQNCVEIFGLPSSGVLEYPAFNACYQLNSRGTLASTAWYLPSISQLMATYLVSANLASTMSAAYWSSTEVVNIGLNAGKNAYSLDKNGTMLESPKNTVGGIFVRAARNLND